MFVILYLGQLCNVVSWTLCGTHTVGPSDTCHLPLNITASEETGPIYKLLTTWKKKKNKAPTVK